MERKGHVNVSRYPQTGYMKLSDDNKKSLYGDYGVLRVVRISAGCDICEADLFWVNYTSAKRCKCGKIFIPDLLIWRIRSPYELVNSLGKIPGICMIVYFDKGQKEVFK
ncbi:MAG: hypothetical protein ABII68_03635 [Pseudomonadota bacterium]